MDTPITRAEHEEFRRTVAARFDVVEAEDKRLNERLKVIEETNKQISDMNVTLQKQSDNITALSKNLADIAKTQDAENARLKALEGRDGEKWRQVVGYLITAVIGAAVTLVFTQMQVS